MNPGKRNKRIIIQEKTVISDEDEGYLKENWIEFKPVWAYCKPHTANEYYKANSINSKATIKFNIRYLRGLDSSMRIKYNNKLYNILSIENVDEANREMWLLGEVVE